MSLPSNPITRKETYLAKIAGQNVTIPDEPITREEMYLDAIAQGGGAGDGDMKKSVYDSDLSVASAGGIKDFVEGALGNYVEKSETAGLLKNDGSVDTNSYATQATSPTEGNIAKLDSNGNLVDSGKSADVIPSSATSSNKLSTESDITDVYKVMGEVGAKNLLPNGIVWHLNNVSTFNGDSSDTNTERARTTPAFSFPYPSRKFTISGYPSKTTELNTVKCFDASKNDLGYAIKDGWSFTTLPNTAYIYILLSGENFVITDFDNLKFMIRLVSDTDSTYQPPCMTNKEITDLLTVEDITSEFTFSQDFTWNNDWTKILKYGRTIDVYLRFVTPSTVESDKTLITIPSKYEPKAQQPKELGLATKAWTNENVGVISYLPTLRFVLTGSDWLADTNGVVHFTYLI